MTAPGGDQVVVGAVAVEVVASARRFARSLRREVDEAFQGVGKSLQRTLNRQFKDQKLRLPIEIADKQVAREARRASRTARAIWGDGVKMRIVIPEAQAAREARAAARAAAKAAGPLALKPQASKGSAAAAGRSASATATKAAKPVQLKASIDRKSISKVLSVLAGVAKAAVVGAAGLAAIGAVGQGISVGLAGIAAAGAGAIQILAQLASVALSAAGALAAIPGALAIAGAGLGTLLIGASGLGAALKETGAAAGGAGGAAVDMGRQIERAARQVTLAERRVSDAQRDAEKAQRDLTRAREDALENLEDLELALARARLDEEAAVRAVAEAQEELQALQGAALADPKAIEEADFAYREAVQTLAEVRDQLGDVTKEQAEAAEKGVEGADVVVDAQERQREAALALEDAQYDLAQAQLDLNEAQTAGAGGGGAGGLASAMSKLAPAAQELVRTLRALAPAWTALRLDVQQALWVGVAAEIKNLADKQLPVLREGLVEVATVLNGAMRDGLRTLASESSQLRLEQILGSSARAFDGLAQAIQPAITALLDLTAVGADVVADLAGPAGELIADFSERISEMAASGELRQLILDGLDALKLLGDALVDVGGIIKGVFSAAGEAEGGGIFGMLDRLNELVNSVAGQEALSTLFTELGRIGDALMPVLLAFGEGLGVVAGAIADIAVAAAPFIADFLGLLAEALASLAPGFIALAPSVVALGEALIPLGTILAELVVGLAPGIEDFLSALGEGLEFLAPVAPIVGEALGDLLTALAPLLPVLGIALAGALTELAIIVDAVANGPLMALIDVFSQLATEWASELLPVLLTLATELFPIFADVGQRLVTAFEPLVPTIQTLAETFAGKLSDAMPDLVDAFSELVLAIADMSVDLLQAMVDAFIQLAPELPALVDAGIALALALADLATALVPLLPDLTDLMLLVLELVTPSNLAALTTLVRLLVGQMRFLADILPGVVAPFRALWELIKSVDWGAIGSAIGGAFSTAWDAVKDFFVNVGGWFADLPGNVASWVGDTAATLRRKGMDIINGFLNAAKERYKAVRDWVRGLGRRVRDAVGGLASTLAGKGRDLIQGLRNGITDRWDAARSWLRGIPGRARDAVGNIGRTLYQAGRDTIQGFINGIAAMGSRLWNAITDLVRDNVPGPVRQVLGLESPSKLFRQFGVDTIRGLVIGIDSQHSAVERSVASLAKVVAQPLPALGGAGLRADDVVATYATSHDVTGSLEPIMSTSSATPDPAPIIVFDAAGADRALAQWLRRAVRTKGGGSVQRYAGVGAAA